VLGLPGLLILILAVFAVVGWVQYYVIAFVFVLSMVLLIKGFGVDRAAKGLYRWAKEYSPPPVRVQISNYSAIAGALVNVLGVYLGGVRAAQAITPQQDIAGYFGLMPSIAGYFIGDAITLIVIGVCVTLLGRAIRWYLERDPRLLRNCALIVTVAWSRQIGVSVSDLLTQNSGAERVVLAVIIGILIGVASVLITFVLRRRSKAFFHEPEGKVEELGED
jgi:uncharacterized membrane protein